MKDRDPHFALCPSWNGGECTCPQTAENVVYGRTSVEVLRGSPLIEALKDD